MQLIQSFFVWIHVSAGFIGLASFWIPVLTRKGGTQHKLFGKIFKYCAYVVLIAAFLAILLRMPQLIQTNFDAPNEVLALSFYVFLFYLILVVSISLRHGFAVLEYKSDITGLNNGLNNALANISMLASIMIIVYAIIVSPDNQILLYALSPIGFFTGLDIKTAIRNKHQFKKTWLYEHLSALLGTGVAFHTAFAVFGAGQIFNLNLSGFIQVIPWITPALIGVPAISIWTRSYKKKFGDWGIVKTKVANES